MAKFSIVDNNISDKQSSLNLLRAFIFNNKNIEMYDEDRVYNKGDQAYIINSEGNIEIVTANEDNITGPYISDNWNTTNLGDIVSVGSNMIKISASVPTENNVQIWITPIEYSSHILPEPVIPTMNVIITANSIPLVEDTDRDLPNIDVGDLVFDVENTSDGVFVENIETPKDVLVDEQDDIVVSSTEPDESDPALLWIDTDVTDG